MRNSLTYAATIGLLSAGAVATPSQAEVQILAGGGVRHETNLFRLSRDASDRLGLRRSDTIGLAQASLNAVFHPSNFDAQIRLRAGKDWYVRNSNLDNFNYQAELGLTRQTNGTFGFDLQARTDRRLTSFGDIRSRLRNIQKFYRITNSTSYAITPDIRIVLDPAYTQNENSAASLRSSDYRQYGAGVGLGYFSPMGNSVAVTVTRRYTKGLRRRPILLAGGIVDSRIDVVDNSVDLKLRYDPSIFTSVIGQLSYVKRNDQSVLDNDYHGPSGSITLIYKPRDSLRMRLTAGRRLDSQSYLFIDSVRNDYIDFNVDMKIYGGAVANLGAEYYRRSFDFNPVGGIAGKRVENNFRVTAGIGYLAFKRLDLGASIAQELRSTNIPDGDYGATIFQATANVAFGSIQ